MELVFLCYARDLSPAVFACVGVYPFVAFTTLGRQIESPAIYDWQLLMQNGKKCKIKQDALKLMKNEAKHILTRAVLPAAKVVVTNNVIFGRENSLEALVLLILPLFRIITCFKCLESYLSVPTRTSPLW